MNKVSFTKRTAAFFLPARGQKIPGEIKTPRTPLFCPFARERRENLITDVNQPFLLKDITAALTITAENPAKNNASIDILCKERFSKIFGVI